MDVKIEGWSRDLATEEKLDQLGVKYDLQLIHPDKLQIDQSRSNNARISQSIDDEFVEQYAVAMEHGDRFPAIVCSSSGYIFSGNHRVSASLLFDSRREILAYVCKNVNKKTKEIIIRTFNKDHGKPLSNEERLQQAVHLYENGLTISDASAKMGVKYERLKEAITVSKIRGVLEDANVKASGIPKASILSLAKLEKKKAVMVACAKRLIDSRGDTILNSEQVSSLVSSVLASKKPMEAIRNYRSGIKPTSVRPGMNKGKLGSMLSNMNSYAQNLESLREIGIVTKADVNELHKTWKKVKSGFDKLFREAKEDKK